MDSPSHASSREKPTSPSHSRPPRLGLAAWLIFLVVVIAAAAGLVPRLHQRHDLQAENKELAIPTVIVTHAAPGGSTNVLALPAELKPFIEAPIYARASGYLKRFQTDLGARVQAGDLLAEIETPELDQELAQARAALAQARAALALASTSAARWSDLLKTASVSEQEAAEKRSDAALKEAVVQGAEANVRRLEELKGFTRVTAPFAGTVTLRRVDVGDLISAGSTRELFRLADTSRLRVQVRVPQTGARAMATGVVAQLTIPEWPGRTFAARVVRTAGAMDAASRTLLTELEADNASGELMAGGYAQVKFPDVRPGATLTLPSNTLLFRPEGALVGLVQAEGKVELRPIEMGRDFGPTVEVLSGVTREDQVILNPADSLTAGSQVRIYRPPAPKTAP